MEQKFVITSVKTSVVLKDITCKSNRNIRLTKSKRGYYTIYICEKIDSITLYFFRNKNVIDSATFSCRPYEFPFKLNYETPGRGTPFVINDSNLFDRISCLVLSENPWGSRFLVDSFTMKVYDINRVLKASFAVKGNLIDSFLKMKLKAIFIKNEILLFDDIYLSNKSEKFYIKNGLYYINGLLCINVLPSEKSNSIPIFPYEYRSNKSSIRARMKHRLCD